MTERTSAFPPTGDGATTQQSTASVAREETAQVGQSARTAAGNVAGTAADQARIVVDETRRQAVDLLGEVRSQVRTQASVQQRKAARNLHTLADQFNEMAVKTGDSGLAAQLAEEASNRVHGVASWLDRGEPTDLLEEVRGFARRRPGTFLLGAVVAGALAGRMTRGLTSAARSGESARSGAWESAGVPADLPDVTHPAGAWPAPAAGPIPAPEPIPVTGSAPGHGGDLSMPEYGTMPEYGAAPEYGGEDPRADIGDDYTYRPGQP